MLSESEVVSVLLDTDAELGDGLLVALVVDFGVVDFIVPVVEAWLLFSSFRQELSIPPISVAAIIIAVILHNIFFMHFPLLSLFLIY